MVVGKLVNKDQITLIKERQITDSALIVGECVDSRLKGDEHGVMCKLDIKKAYDQGIQNGKPPAKQLSVEWRKVWRNLAPTK
ncbi:hypothetical protein MTR67_052576, partial [Solanum verrucosum]